MHQRHQLVTTGTEPCEIKASALNNQVDAITHPRAFLQRTSNSEAILCDTQRKGSRPRTELKNTQKLLLQIQGKQLKTLKPRNMLLCQSRNTIMDLASSLLRLAQTLPVITQTNVFFPRSGRTRCAPTIHDYSAAVSTPIPLLS